MIRKILLLSNGCGFLDGGCVRGRIFGIRGMGRLGRGTFCGGK